MEHLKHSQLHSYKPHESGDIVKMGDQEYTYIEGYVDGKRKVFFLKKQ